MITKHLVKRLFKKPKKNMSFFTNIGSKWILLNFGIIIIWAFIYMKIDDKSQSIFKGMDRSKNTYFDYLYFSVIITSTLGLGEIVPDPEKKRTNTVRGRIAVMIHILTSLFLNDILDSYENLILS